MWKAKVYKLKSEKVELGQNWKAAYKEISSAYNVLQSKISDFERTHRAVESDLKEWGLEPSKVWGSDWNNAEQIIKQLR